MENKKMKLKTLIKLTHRGEKGFTLIELLVVMAILGVLAGIAIPAVATVMGRGVEEAALTERDDVQLAVVAAMAEIPVGELSAVCELHPDGTNTCQYDNPTTNAVDLNALNVENYIIGGLESLSYQYGVDRDGKVRALTGPAS